MGFGVWGLGFGVWCLGFGVWCLVFGVWCLVFGVWCLVFGVPLSSDLKHSKTAITRFQSFRCPPDSSHGFECSFKAMTGIWRIPNAPHVWQTERRPLATAVRAWSSGNQAPTAVPHGHGLCRGSRDHPQHQLKRRIQSPFRSVACSHMSGTLERGYLDKRIQTLMAQGRSAKIISMIQWIRTSRFSIKNSL